MRWFTVEQSICYYQKIRTGKINLIPWNWPYERRIHLKLPHRNPRLSAEGGGTALMSRSAASLSSCPVKQQCYAMYGHDRNDRFATAICCLVPKTWGWGASQSAYGNQSTAEALWPAWRFLTSPQLFQKLKHFQAKAFVFLDFSYFF